MPVCLCRMCPQLLMERSSCDIWFGWWLYLVCGGHMVLDLIWYYYNLVFVLNNNNYNNNNNKTKGSLKDHDLPQMKWPDIKYIYPICHTDPHTHAIHPPTAITLQHAPVQELSPSAVLGTHRIINSRYRRLLLALYMTPCTDLRAVWWWAYVDYVPLRILHINYYSLSVVVVVVHLHA